MPEGADLRMRAVEQHVFFILDVSSVTMITDWGKSRGPRSLLNLKSVHPHPESGCTTLNLFWNIQEHVFWHSEGRVNSMSLSCRESTPLMVGESSAVGISGVRCRELDPGS